jgi:23S rRNA (uracil1939-C5)-methyltransferase
VTAPSPERVEPLCRYFGECGGCQYQHLAYPAQLRLKHKQIGDLFQRIGRFDPGLIAPVIPCPEPYGYRNRIMIRTQWDKFKQGLNIGFIRNDSRLVLDLEECKIAEPTLNDQIKYVRAHPPPKGGIKVVLRIPPEGWEVPPDSFFQTNFSLLPGLVQVVRDRLRDANTRHLLDVYCGVGFFSIELAHLVESFVGVELDRLAIRLRVATLLAHAPTASLLPGPRRNCSGAPDAFHGPRDNRPARPAPQRLPAGDVAVAPPGATLASHLRLLPPGDHGA